MPIETAWGERLKEIRTAAKISQRELAARMVEAGHSAWVQSTVGRTEAGARPLRLAEFVDLCRTLDQDPAVWLMGLREPLSDDEVRVGELKAMLRAAERDSRRADSQAQEMRAVVAAVSAELEQAQAELRNAT